MGSAEEEVRRSHQDGEPRVACRARSLGRRRKLGDHRTVGDRFLDVRGTGVVVAGDRQSALAAQLGEHGAVRDAVLLLLLDPRSEEHTSELQSLMRISYAVFCLKKKKQNT